METETEPSGSGQETNDSQKVHTMLDSKFPVFVPYSKELFLSDAEFHEYQKTVKGQATLKAKDPPNATTAPQSSNAAAASNQFMANLLENDHRFHTKETLAEENKMLTENQDVTNISAQDPIVDLWYNLNSAGADADLLSKAWEQDALATLKIIFNARSIHVGKAEKYGAYRALGWLYQYHPQTLLTNLTWLTRPVISKPKCDAEQKEGEEGTEGKDDEPKAEHAKDAEEFVVLLPENAHRQLHETAFDVENGLAHGYWKDLLNILVLAVGGNFSLSPVKPFQSIFTFKNTDVASPFKAKKLGLPKREWDHDKAKVNRKKRLEDQHKIFVAKFTDNPKFRALHLTVARLFANQLRHDLDLLRTGNPADVRRISLAAKWAPSPKEFHDKNCFVASSIAELLLPHDDVCPEVPKGDRETYLKHARLAYRTKVLSPLRKALLIVEQEITSGTYKNIRYQTVPSLAMQRYSGLFYRKDREHFGKYLQKVAEGKTSISGAVLLPSTLVASTRTAHRGLSPEVRKIILDGQWRTLVQRVRDSGSFSSSIAVVDVSGSMYNPRMKDGTTPLDSSIGLGLLISELTKPPFGGTFITFSKSPQVVRVDGKNQEGKVHTFTEKINIIENSPMGYNTDLVAVFDRLILPMAIKNKIPKEDMVKTVFVFSDMQFDQAEPRPYGGHANERWSSSFDRIKKRYEEAGYDMPQLVFWNLADTRSKGVPVTSTVPGTALVSGYSQGQMKVFLENGKVDDEDDDEEPEIEEGKEEGEEDVVTVKKKSKEMNPRRVVDKALGKSVYAMLRVED